MAKQPASAGQSVSVVVYRWAGAWGPFEVRIPCGECALTRDVIRDTLHHELAGVDVALDVRDWLGEWWRPLLKGGWHPPIVMVEGRVVSQGQALNRGVLTQAVIDAAAAKTPVRGNHVFGKSGCPHCERARRYLDEAAIAYSYHDVVRDPRALYEMLARVKPIIGPKTPVTVPQIWLDGNHVGGADQLSRRLHRTVEPNPERGRSSLSPSRVAANAG
ncbi:MAG: glutaredoxin [Rhodocyclaceae bacterium]|nr:glutaredoxin [Rhodocyclaceae bacterium]